MLKVLNCAKHSNLKYSSLINKPTSSEALSCYLKQCREPPWTSYFIKVHIDINVLFIIKILAIDGMPTVSPNTRIET